MENGIKKRKITTKGWDLKVEWKNGTSSWIPLKDLKESNPIEIYFTSHDSMVGNIMY